ncbi:MAG TPA: DUF1579 family protein [Bacteroidota bacterium]|nr:DUF1579 family protein [Bacteroidota bacterium]
MSPTLLMRMLTALLLCSAGAFGQAAPGTPPRPHRTMATERSKIAFLVGSYTTTAAIPPAPGIPKGGSGTGTCVISWALDSMFLSISEKSVNSVLGKYAGYGMLGFDPQREMFVLTMFNNFGDRPQYQGSMVSDTLVLTTSISAPKGTFQQKILWYRDGKKVRLQVLNDFGKGYVPALDETSTPVAGKR